MACGPDAPSQTQSVWFPVSAGVGPEGLRGHVRTGGKVRWSVLWETAMSVLPREQKTCPILHYYACLHPGPSLIRMSTAILRFLQLRSCYWFLLLPSCQCQIPLQSATFPHLSKLFLFHFSNPWYHCFPSSETYFNDEIILPLSK